MKIKLLLRWGILPLAVLLLSFTDPYSIKRVTDTSFKYEFYTSQKKINTRPGRQYYWFKGGAIHNSESGIAGELLQETFVKFYLNNQLAEKGSFVNGLKTGVWKTWYPNGKIQSIENWKNGLKKGSSKNYDQNGTLLEEGTFKRNVKHGLWIDAIKKDTVMYKNGNIFIKKPKLTKEEKAVEKIKKQAAQATKKEAKENQLKNKSTDKTPRESFFKRMYLKVFPKKDAKSKANG